MPPLSVPDELLISEYEAYKSLSSLQTSKAVGPDNIPNRILKDFALELAPLVCDIYNQSLKEGTYQLFWNRLLLHLSLRCLHPLLLNKI